jgi:DNA-binding beta-propeller fold protein YncE
MKRNRTIKTLLALAVVSAFIYGCAAPLPDLIWPSPPDPPRIKYIKAYRSGTDLDKGSVAAGLLMGAKASIRLQKPMSVYAARDGKLYVTDTANADVLIFDQANKKAGSLRAMGVYGLFKPIGFTQDSTGRMFVSDSQTDKVHVLDAEGKALSLLEPGTPFKQPTGMAIDEERKRLYVTDTHNHHIEVFDLETLEYVQTIGSRGSEEGEFNYPSHITLDGKGTLYVTDTMNGRVQTFDRQGRFIMAFGQFGDAPGMFARPKGIGVDSEGHIYVVDAAFNNVQIFDEEGRILMDFSGYGSGRGQMILPSGIAIDQDDFIYVIDSWNARVEVFEYLGEKHRQREGKNK